MVLLFLSIPILEDLWAWLSQSSLINIRSVSPQHHLHFAMTTEVTKESVEKVRGSLKETLILA